MHDRSSQSIVDEQPSFIAKCDLRYPTWLANDAHRRIELLRDEVRAFAGSDFLFNRPDDNHTPAIGNRRMCHRFRECTQRPFRVYTASTIQHVIVNPHVNRARKRVDVTEQYQRTGCICVATNAAGIPDLIHTRFKPMRRHPLDQTIDCFRFLP